jgi:hypothetical protein
MVMGIMIFERPAEARWGAGLVLLGTLIYVFTRPSGAGKENR